MKTHTKVLGVLVVTLGMFAVAGVIAAAPADTLQPAHTITYSEEVIVNNTFKANSAYIGSTVAGVGGVTFFNGSIVNNSVDEDGESTIPVTFADNVRIDGEIYRTEVGGENPIKLADTIRPQTNNTYDLGTSVYNFKDGYFAGTVSAGTVSAGNIYTKTEVDALVATGGHDHVGETWSGSVTSGTAPSVLTLANTGSGSGLVAASSGNAVGIAGGASGTSAAVYGVNTSSGPGVSGISTSGYGVYASSTSGTSLYVDGKVGMNAAANKAVGTGTITAGDQNVVISNTTVTANSIILLTIGHADSAAGVINQASGIRVSDVSAGASFTVATLNGIAQGDNDIPFSYLIIN
ncbi:hypothetical protein KJ903_05825 [Patescibacteria group bacterium]|nr:hypothetical protein [Patescibacteria group bacterium]